MAAGPASTPRESGYPRHGREIAAALAQRFTEIVPREVTDERALLAPFANPDVARRISAIVDSGLREEGRRMSVAEVRGSRVATLNDATYLLPTVVHCQSPDHPLANREFLFPFASVVEVDPRELPERLGPTAGGDGV
jgi:acyl-CoA reductase-like NAD-dependent aldehyde dehydrogenase